MTNRADNFNRANSSTSPGSPSDGGSGYLNAGSDIWGIDTNQLKWVSGFNSSFFLNLLPLETGVTTVDTQATYTVASAAGAGLLMRYVDTSNFNYCFFYTAAGGTVQLGKRVAGSSTTLGNFTGISAIANGCVPKVTVNASDQWDLYVSGSLVNTGGHITDSANNTGTKFGFMCNSDTSVRWDDLTTTDNSASGNSGAFASAGSGSMTMTGASIAAGAMNSAGAGSMTMTGAAVAAGVLSASGAGVMNETGAALAAGVLASAGAGTAQFVGASVNSAAGDFSASGTGLFTPTGAALALGGMTSAGTSTADFRAPADVTPTPPLVETDPGPGGGAKGGNQWSEAERRRREREQRKREMLIAAIKGIAPSVFQAMSRPGYIHINRTLH